MLWLICSFNCAARSVQEGVHYYDVGVLALRGHEHAQRSWRPTLDWLESQIPEANFILHTYDFDQLDHAFSYDQLDFLLTSPGQATRIAREYPLNWLATQKTTYSNQSSKSIASVVVVRADSPYKTLKDIRKADVAAVSEKAFGGFLALRYELDKLGYFNSSFFQDIQFTGPPTDQLLINVAENQLDVAIVPACTLENMAKESLIDIRELRVLGAIRPQGSVCEVSTPLYPNWTFAKTDRASNAIGKKVTQALLEMPDDHFAAKAANNIGWTLPASSVDVDKVYKHLDMHPLQKSWQESFKKWLYRNQLLASMFVFGFILIGVYHLLLQYRFQRNTRKLEQTLFELKEKNTMLEHTQRTMIIGELGSSLAHEINQPLATITNYSIGAQRRIEQGIGAEELLPILEKIQQQVGAASDIIQRLRGLIKKNPMIKTVCDPIDFVRESVQLIEYDFQARNIRLELNVEGRPLMSLFDYIGMQQLVLNLLRNAKEACLANNDLTEPAVVTLDLHYESSNVILRVEDNGIGLAATEEQVKQAFYTTKTDGLGLGLAICRDVVEAHYGKMMIQPCQPKGCQVTIIIPVRIKEGQNDE